MAIRAKIENRTPIKNVEAEYVRAGGGRRPRKGGSRGRLLDVSETSVELGTRESFRPGEKVQISLHVKGIRDYVKLEGEVEKSARVSIVGQPAFAVAMKCEKLTAEQEKKLAWAASRYGRKAEPRQIRREMEAVPETKAPGAETAAPEAAPEGPAAAEAAPVPKTGPEVKRPVALLELIDRLDKFEVTNDLVMAVIEAAEAGMDVEVLYPKARREQTAEVAAEGDGLPADGEARPMSVYRLASNTQLYFSDKSLPVGPGAELIYLSRLKTPDKCFAVELGVDSMSHEGGMSFKRGSILIFSIEQEVASGDFAFVKWRRGDVFAQVFIEKDDSIRIRALNPKYPERAVKRREVRLMFKLVGCYQDFS